MTTDLVDLQGCVAMVTGAGQGVGRQVALHFADHNAGTVIINDVNRERAEAVAEEVRQRGCNARAANFDVTDRDAVNDSVRELQADIGPIDCLVNNAGNMGANPEKVKPEPFWLSTTETWDAFLRVNLYGVMNCTSAVVPGMIEKKSGRIVTVISDAGRVGEPGLEIYSGAKAGAAGFMRATARSLARYGINANCVAISTTRTPGVSDVTENPELSERMLRNYVIRRFGEPEDVANMVLFLASGAASWITGQTYPVNGGFSFNQ
jgi:2-hydroxycyclohexanecarboxyl-CoA dehydrogenase